jgi:hypothetical protein
MNEHIASEILAIVKEYNGIKDRELKSELIGRFNHTMAPTSAEIDALLEQLVRSSKLIEIEYSIDMASVRSLYLPGNVSLNVRGQRL